MLYLGKVQIKQVVLWGKKTRWWEDISNSFFSVVHVCMKARLNPIWRPNIVVFDNTPMILTISREYHSIAFLISRKAEPMGLLQGLLLLNLFHTWILVAAVCFKVQKSKHCQQSYLVLFKSASSQHAWKYAAKNYFKSWNKPNFTNHSVRATTVTPLQ